jgi:hypothetical protein
MTTNGAAVIAEVRNGGAAMIKKCALHCESLHCDLHCQNLASLESLKITYEKTSGS